jgi:hypothetical protein
MWLTPIKLYPVHDHSYRNWNQRAVIEYALKRSLGCCDN